MKPNEMSRTNIITTIGVGLAAIIGGGFSIVQLAMVLPVPGAKYVIISPFMAFGLFIIAEKINHKFTYGMMGLALGLILSMISLYMGLAIILTTIVSQLAVILVYRNKFRNYVGAIVFASATVIFSLLISKYMIGGVFESLKFSWILGLSSIGLIAGFIGSYAGGKIMKYFRKAI